MPENATKHSAIDSARRDDFGGIFKNFRTAKFRNLFLSLCFRGHGNLTTLKFGVFQKYIHIYVRRY